MALNESREMYLETIYISSVRPNPLFVLWILPNIWAIQSRVSVVL